MEDPASASEGHRVSGGMVMAKMTKVLLSLLAQLIFTQVRRTEGAARHSDDGSKGRKRAEAMKGKAVSVAHI